MRNYQTLTVIGGVITILVALATWAIFASTDIFHGAFNEFESKYATQQQLQKYNEGRQMFANGLAYMQVAIPTAIFVNIFAMIGVFVFKDKVKVVGSLLIVIGIISIITIGAFGIVSLGIFITAGIVALRYKVARKETTSIPSTTATEIKHGGPFA
jgi:hypothetical protein